MSEMAYLNEAVRQPELTGKPQKWVGSCNGDSPNIGAPSTCTLAVDELDALQKKLNYQFHNVDLLLTALTHRSYAHEAPHPVEHNERLEFLGDAVLNLIVAAALLDTYAEREGALSKLRAGLVNFTRLAELAQLLEFGRLLRVGKSLRTAPELSDLPALLADTFEAVLGAIFVDGGYDAARRVGVALFGDPIRRVGRDMEEQHRDHKSALQEFVVQKFNCIPTYKTIREEGPAHARQFFVEVIIDGQPVATGTGRTKKEASKQAASQAMDLLRSRAITEPRSEEQIA